MQDFFFIPIQSFTQNPFFLISMNYTHEDIRYLSPFLSIVKHPITLASWGVYESHLDSLFYVHYPIYYSGLSYIFQFIARGFPRRVISHPYCYVHYNVLDTTCVIGCLMNDILILFLCLLSPMLFGVFLISFSLVLGDFPASILAIVSYVFVHFLEYHSRILVFLL